MEKGQLRQVILKDKNLKNVHTVSNMLRTLQTHIVKRLAKAFKEWNNYIILKKIIDKEKSLQITRKLEPGLDAGDRSPTRYPENSNPDRMLGKGWITRKLEN